MLSLSQPLDSKYSEILEEKRKYKDEENEFSERKIKSQYIGKMLEDLLDEDKKRKIGLRLRLTWLWRDITGFFYDVKYGIRNFFKWRKTIRGLRPWEGFDGLISVMQTHLKDYIETEIKYGHSEEEYRKRKIATAKETVELLESMKDPSGYFGRLRDEVESHYPDYKGLNTEYENGGSSFCGDFIAQGDGWAGKESGNNPRAGYFEFVNGRFTLTKSPDENETNRILAELEKYHEEITNVYKQAEIDSNNDFDCLCQLLKDNLYSWWD
jgi:hypothetical protein